MRLLCTLNNEAQGQILGSYLAKIGIDNQIEIDTNTDWGSNEYGNINCRIWVYDEDQFDQAQSIADDFFKSPDDAKFQISERAAKSILEPVQSSIKKAPQNLVRATRDFSFNRESLGVITLYLLVLCAIIFIFDQLTSPKYERISTAIPYTPVFSSPLKKQLLYDYPHAFVYIDKLVSLYGIEKLQAPEDLPAEGKYLIEQYLTTPYWQGIYNQIVSRLKHITSNWDFKAPMFEKIRQGEVWRLFTPALMHYDIFHIFFNMIWLIVLGRQIEQRIGKWKYILFVLATGIFSNTCQYLMSGINFLGFSGVLCAMLTFIWVRQRRAAWEGYQMQGGTFAFVAFFILAMFALQLSSFLFEVFGTLSIPSGIANTAHLAGALIGYILGRWNFFAWKPS
jgi:GlpG protein